LAGNCGLSEGYYPDKENQTKREENIRYWNFNSRCSSTKIITIRKTTFQHNDEGNRDDSYNASSKRNKRFQMLLRNLCDNLRKIKINTFMIQRVFIM